MQQILAQIYTYVIGVWRFRWLALGVTWTLSVAGWLWVWSLPESYLATARLDVDSTNILRPLLRGLAIQPDVEQRVALMSKTLLSRPNLEKLMRMADLDLSVTSDLEEERLLTSIKESISLRGDRQNSSLYSVSFKHEDRATAKKVVQSLMTIFIESTLGEKRKDSSGAQAFLDQQIADYELRLSEAEQRVADFKQRNVGMLPGEAGGYYQRLDMARNQLSSARLQLKELENRRNELSRQLKGEEPVFFSATSKNSSGMGSPLDHRINTLQEKLDFLSISYTELHPEVVQIKHKIEALKNERDAEYEKSTSMPSTENSNYSSSPVYLNMRTMMAETEAKVAELTVRVQEYDSRVKALENTVNSIPDIEVELQQLDRDYQVIAQQHNALLKRRESALLSEKVEKNADDIKFRIIDPPYVPLKPTEPDKLMLNVVVLMFSLAVGGAVGFVFSLFSPVFVDRRTVSEKLGLPVLGCVTLMLPPEQARKEFRSSMVYLTMVASLLVVFTGVNLGQNLFF
ncbi:MAG: XrtA system polysaccharide chain length determinant [Cellvibrionaceae bacterium]